MQVNIPVELIINTVLTGIIAWAVKAVLDGLAAYRKESSEWRKAMDNKVDAINDATQANTRTNILHYCEKYLNRGWVTREELDSLVDMHAKYTALNDHNGFINNYMDRVQKLDIREI